MRAELFIGSRPFLSLVDDDMFGWAASRPETETAFFI